MENPRVWDLRETPEDLAFKGKLRRFAAYLRQVRKKVQKLRVECMALPSCQEAERMYEAGLEDPPTVGFRLLGELEGAIQELDDRAEHLDRAAAETVDDLLRSRCHGTADLGQFRR